MKRKSHGIRIIGKPFQYDNEQYAVVKTQMGYYARIRGKGHFKTGDRHKTSAGARKELMKDYHAKKRFIELQRRKK